MSEFISGTSSAIGIVEKLRRLWSEKRNGQPVRYRDTIRLKHVKTNRALHSHIHKYSHPHSSGQQQVTAYEGSDSSDYWIIKGQHGLPADYKMGEPIRHGDVIRLEHVVTKKNLHSHCDMPSPVTGQQEVTAYGDNGEGDTNDNWRVEVVGGGTWHEKKRVRLEHVDTKHVLHSRAGYWHPQFTFGQQEVTCFSARDDNALWIIDR